MMLQAQHMPLTLDQVRELADKKKVVIWTEAKCGSDPEPKILAGIKTVKGWGEMLMFTDGESMWLESYNRTWRAWLMFHPRPEERRAHAWGA